MNETLQNYLKIIKKKRWTVCLIAYIYECVCLKTKNKTNYYEIGQ